MTDSSPDPYKTLQVDPEAEDEVIQAAYRRLAQKYHPDRTESPETIARMVAINAAWELIGEPDRRETFDRARRDEAAATARAAADANREANDPTRAGTDSRRAATLRSARAAGRPGPVRPPEAVSGDWTSGRSGVGSGYDPASMRADDGLGAAGSPPGNPSGTVLGFGRYAGWSLGEIAGRDLEYIEWLDRMPIGRPHRDEIDGLLRRAGRRRGAIVEAVERRGLFRRR